MKKKYETTDFATGEIVEFETSVDIDLLEEYNEWVVERKLFPPQHTPREYAEYIEAKQAKENVLKAIEMIERYDQNIPWPADMVKDLLNILRGDNG